MRLLVHIMPYRGSLQFMKFGGNEIQNRENAKLRKLLDQKPNETFDAGQSITIASMEKQLNDSIEERQTARQRRTH